MFIKKGKTNWLLIVIVALVAGAAGGLLSSYINDLVTLEVSLSNANEIRHSIPNAAVSNAKDCGVGEGYDLSLCNRQCSEDTDCMLFCGCGAINKNENCYTNGIVFECVDMKVSCQAGKCVTEGE